MALLLKSLAVYAALVALTVITALVKPHVIAAILDAIDETYSN